MKKNNPFRRFAAFLVTFYAGRIYDRARRRADERHAKEKTTIYVIVNPMDSRGLATCSRKEFRKMKELLRRRSPTYSVTLMKNGSYYHTADAGEKNAMSKTDMAVRRIAFIREALNRSGLI